METLSTLLALYEGNSTVSSQQANNEEIWCWYEQAIEQTIELPVIWDAWQCNDSN